MRKRNVLIAGLLTISPLTVAFAQGTAHDTKAGSSIGGASKDAGAVDSHKPGATGSAVVPGDKSTVAGDRKATMDTKSGGVSGGR